MMNYIHTHIENEDSPKIEVSEEFEMNEEKYRTLKLGSSLTIFMTNEQLETLFDELDKQLHKETYLQLQDKIFSLESDLEEANNLIEQYQEN